MKTIKTLATTLATVLALSTLLVGCKQIPLEEQIAVKEPNSWDIKSVSGKRYIRIYDSPEKLGWFIYEFGQKGTCNQGFQKVIKTAAPGLVQYVLDPVNKSFACDGTLRYIFRTDAQGHPYEGWETYVSDRKKENLSELVKTVAYFEKMGSKPTHFLVK